MSIGTLAWCIIGTKQLQVKLDEAFALKKQDKLDPRSPLINECRNLFAKIIIATKENPAILENESLAASIDRIRGQISQLEPQKSSACLKATIAATALIGAAAAVGTAYYCSDRK